MDKIFNIKVKDKKHQKESQEDLAKYFKKIERKLAELKESFEEELSD